MSISVPGLSHIVVPKSRIATVQEAWHHMDAMRPELAEQIFRIGAVTHPDCIDMRLGHVAALGWSGRLDEAESLCREVLSRCMSNGHYIIASYYLGSLVANRRQFDEANELFSCFSGKLTWAAGGNMRSVRFGKSSNADSFPFERKVYGIDTISDIEGEYVYTVCCDERYLKLFGRAVYRSVTQHTLAPCAIHFHVVNPTEDCFAFIDGLRANGSTPVVMSYETTDLRSLNPEQRKVYYSCARFLIIEDLLDAYKRPLVVADADQLMVRDPTYLFFTTADVRMVRAASYACNIMARFSASAIVVRDTRGSREFFRHVSAYLAERMSDPIAIAWHLDQVALGVAELELPTVRMEDLPPAVMQSSRPDEPISYKTVFWSVTYSVMANARKIDSQVFQQYMS